MTVPPLLLLWCAGLLTVTGVELDVAASRAVALEPLELTGVFSFPPPGLNSFWTAAADRSAPPVAEEDLRAGSV